MGEVYLLAAQMRAAEVRSAVVQFTKENGLFREENVSAYLRLFETTVRQWELSDAELMRCFKLTVHEDSSVKVAKATVLTDTWDETKECLREAFRARDETRMTAKRFAEWVRREKKDSVDPETILREFDREFEQLDKREQAHFFDKTEWLIRALPASLRKEATRRLRNGEDLTADWDRVEEVMHDLSQRDRVLRRVEELDGLGVEERRDQGAPERGEKEGNGVGCPKGNSVGSRPESESALTRDREAGELNDLVRQMGALRLDLNRVLSAGQYGVHSPQSSGIPPAMVPPAQGVGYGYGPPPRVAPPQPDLCIWCDVAGHRRAQCQNFQAALNAGAVQLVAGRVCRPDGTTLPTRFGRGGIRQAVRDERDQADARSQTQATGGAPPTGPTAGRSYAVKIQEILDDGSEWEVPSKAASTSKVSWEWERAGRTEPPAAGGRVGELYDPGEWGPARTVGSAGCQVTCNHADTQVYEKRVRGEAAGGPEKRHRADAWMAPAPRGTGDRSRRSAAGGPSEVTRASTRGDGGGFAGRDARDAQRPPEKGKSAVEIQEKKRGQLRSAVQEGFDVGAFVDTRFLNQEVTMTWSEFLAACAEGPSGVPSRMMGVVRRKRVPVEAPSVAAAVDHVVVDHDDNERASERVSAYIEEDDWEETVTVHSAPASIAEAPTVAEAKVYRAKAEGARAEPPVLHRASEALWARPVSETCVYVPAIKRSVTALVDSGSEINLAEQWLAEEAGWPMVMSPGWVLHTAVGKDSIYGACPNVPLVVSDFQTRHNIFVRPTLGYDLILGQPWRAKLRYTSIWKDDGSEVGRVSSLDGEQTVQFRVVSPTDHRHRVYLKYRGAEPPPGLAERLQDLGPSGFQEAAL